MSRPNGSSLTTASYFYDGNGNVTDLAFDDGTAAAHYTYSPFGERLTATGTWADSNPYQFSSKELDPTTGFYYYGLRYYNPSSGRWLGRDPIEEDGGVNLYAFVSNNPLDHFDILGLALSRYDGDLTALPFVETDIQKKFRNNAIGRTDQGWPLRDVASVNGTTVSISGELKPGFEVQIGNDPNDDSNTADGMTIKAHELLHGEHVKNAWNSSLDSVNQWEGTYCVKTCAEKAAEIANATNFYNFYMQQAGNLDIDVKKYQSAVGKKGAKQSRNIAALIKQKIDKLTDEFHAANCGGQND